jgi:hypothetical protein
LYVTEQRHRPERPLKDRLKEAIDGFVEELAGMLRPEPDLIPVPVRRPPHPRRRRR